MPTAPPEEDAMRILGVWAVVSRIHEVLMVRGIPKKEKINKTSK